MPCERFTVCVGGGAGAEAVLLEMRLERLEASRQEVIEHDIVPPHNRVVRPVLGEDLLAKL